MRIATTTSDFSAYTVDALEAMEYIQKAGFRYIDYNFCVEYNNKTGLFGEDEHYQCISILTRQKIVIFTQVYKYVIVKKGR